MTHNPFNEQATAILRPLCLALCAMNRADGEGSILPPNVAGKAFCDVHSGVVEMIELLFPALRGTRWTNGINYGGNEDFFYDFCAAVNDELKRQNPFQQGRTFEVLRLVRGELVMSGLTQDVEKNFSENSRCSFRDSETGETFARNGKRID